MSIAQIAKSALDAVALSEVGEAIKAAQLSVDGGEVYNSTTGSYEAQLISKGDCRAVIDTLKPIGDVFPEYQAGEAEILIFIEGFAEMPQENWLITIDDDQRTITKAQDILGVGIIAYVVAR